MFSLIILNSGDLITICICMFTTFSSQWNWEVWRSIPYFLCYRGGGGSYWFKGPFTSYVIEFLKIYLIHIKTLPTKQIIFNFPHYVEVEDQGDGEQVIHAKVYNRRVHPLEEYNDKKAWLLWEYNVPRPFLPWACLVIARVECAMPHFADGLAWLLWE